jgi:5'-nucleotidase
MSVDLSKCLVIGVSSRALFDLEAANRVYQTEEVDAYARYQLEKVDEVLQPGSGFPLIQAILRLNERARGPGQRRAEVVIVTKNNPATSLRLFDAIKHHGLDIQRAILTGGAATAPYLRAFQMDLFLSASTTVRTSRPATVGVLPIGDPKDDHKQPVIPNCVDDPIVAYANPVEVVYPAKLLDTVRPWFKSQCIDTRRNALLNFPGKAGELLERRWGDLKLIARFRSYRHLSEP